MTVIPGGTHTYSKSRFHFSDGLPDAVEGLGCWLECSNGHGYIDTVAGLGAISLGYRYPAVDHAIKNQLTCGISFSLATELEETVGQRLLDFVGWGERVRFSKNGADVTNLAVRLARAHTGRDGIVALDYHGHDDWCQIRSPDQAVGIPWAWNHYVAEAPGEIIAGGVPAAVILEPMPATGAPRTSDDLCRIAIWAKNRGALLIYDCMITGMRLNARGWPDDAPEPDLACYGKAMGNGMPLSACVGPAYLMDRITEDVFFSTTFGGEALSLAAASAVLKAYGERDVLRRIHDTGEALSAALGIEAGRVGLGDQLEIIDACGPARPMHRWQTEEQAATFATGMIEAGVLYQGYHNLMLATCYEAPIEAIGSAYQFALGRVAAL